MFNGKIHYPGSKIVIGLEMLGVYWSYVCQLSYQVIGHLMSSLIATACIKRSPCPIQVGQPQIARGPRIFRRPCRSSVILGPGDSHPPSGNDYSVTIAWPARKSQLSGKSPPKKLSTVKLNSCLVDWELDGLLAVWHGLTGRINTSTFFGYMSFSLLWGYKDWTNMDLVVYTWLLFQPNPMGLPSGILHTQTHTHTHTHKNKSECQGNKEPTDIQTYKQTSSHTRARTHTHVYACIIHKFNVMTQWNTQNSKLPNMHSNHHVSQNMGTNFANMTLQKKTHLFTWCCSREPCVLPPKYETLPNTVFFLHDSNARLMW